MREIEERREKRDEMERKEKKEKKEKNNMVEAEWDCSLLYCLSSLVVWIHLDVDGRLGFVGFGH
jgi:hypothetical protein